MAYSMIFEVVKIDPEFIIDFLSSLCYDNVFGIELDVITAKDYDEIKESIKDNPEFVYGTLCVEDIYMEALLQGKLIANDREASKEYILTTDMLKKGLCIYMSLPYTNKDFENMDTVDYANLLQCAIFEDVIYG